STEGVGGNGGRVVGRRDLEVPQPPRAAHPVLLAEELHGERLLHPTVHVVEEHVRLPLPAPPPCHNSRRVDRRHPPRCLREVPLGRVDHQHVPFPLVHLPRQPHQRQRAPAVVLQALHPVHPAGPALRVLAVTPQKLLRLRQLGAILDVVRPQLGRVLLYRRVPLRILLEEDGGASGVQGRPHLGVPSQAEDQEVAGGAPSEHVEGQPDLVSGLLRHHRGGGVVEEGLGEFGRGVGRAGEARIERAVEAAVEEAGDEERAGDEGSPRGRGEQWLLRQRPH
ncbi:unnamed protein product, partial [Musa acuminata subsp. malaccensis]